MNTPENHAPEGQKFWFSPEVNWDNDYYGLNSPDNPVSHEVHTLTCYVENEVNEITVNVDATPFDQDSREELVRRIIVAVNNHDRLLELVKSRCGCEFVSPFDDACRALIAEIEGGRD